MHNKAVVIAAITDVIHWAKVFSAPIEVIPILEDAKRHTNDKNNWEETYRLLIKAKTISKRRFMSEKRRNKKLYDEKLKPSCDEFIARLDRAAHAVAAFSRYMERKNRYKRIKNQVV